MPKVNQTLLLAIDPSLTCSGWALFCVATENLLGFGTLRAPGTKFSMATRLEELQRMSDALLVQLGMQANDFLLCEGPAQLVLNPQSSLKVEQVRSLIESVARSRGLIVPGRLNPRTVQTELLGMRGAQIKREEVKRWARATAERLFGKELAKVPCNGELLEGGVIPQDCIDAILIGVLATARIKSALRSNTDPISAFVERSSSGQRRNGRGAPRFATLPVVKHKLG